MRALFIWPNDGATGWAHAAIDQILALDGAGVEVVCRSVRTFGTPTPLPERIRELEARPLSGGFDAVIQHVLPEWMERDTRLGRNVGRYFTETSEVGGSWPRHLSLMDELWVPSPHAASAARKAGIDVPATVIPVPLDMARFERGYAPLPLRDEIGDAFAFYAIGEFLPRKNLSALVMAFHLEFDPDEPVELVIRAGVRGMSHQDGAAHVRKYLDEVRRGLHLYDDPALYKSERLVVGPLDDEGVMRLHASCDCFVSASHGEGEALPAKTAMAMGKTPIVPEWGPFTHWLGGGGWFVSGQESPVIRMQDAHRDLYSADQEWFTPSIPALRRAMREAYSSPHARRAKAEQGIIRAYDYSREAVGRLMKEALER